MTSYIISNVPSLGPYEHEWNTLEAAEQYMTERGYVYVNSMPCDHPTEEARYYIHTRVLEEAGFSAGDPIDDDFLNELLETEYGYGYEPTITPHEK